MNCLPKLSRVKLYGNRLTCCTRQNDDIILKSVSVILCRTLYATYRLAKYLWKRVLETFFGAVMKKPGHIETPPPSNIYLVQKETQCFYLQFLGLKILISKVVLIQWFCPLINTLIAEFRRKLDTVLCFECKILKS